MVLEGGWEENAEQVWVYLNAQRFKRRGGTETTLLVHDDHTLSRMTQGEQNSDTTVARLVLRNLSPLLYPEVEHHPSSSCVQKVG